METVASRELAQLLFTSIELDAAALHVGRYCGPWRGSTAGSDMASFHMILQGSCYLHCAGQPPVLLRERDGVFLMHGTAHFLSPYADPAAIIGGQALQPLDGKADGSSTGLACGFFRFRGALSPLVIDTFPEYLVCRSDAAQARHTAALFEMIIAEGEGGEPLRPSALIVRLVELLLFYLVRQATQGQTVTVGLLALAQHAEFSELLERMLQQPAADWSIARMAQVAHMSRAAFCKHFTSVSGISPARFLLRLRMSAAATHLSQGESVEQVAEQVGYQSSAAFTRAFKRIVGAQPGAYRRQSHRKTFEQEMSTKEYGGRALQAR